MPGGPMSQKNRQGVLRSRPKGLVADGDIELIETELPELVGGEALVKTTLVGIDAAAHLAGRSTGVPAAGAGR